MKDPKSSCWSLPAGHLSTDQFKLSFVNITAPITEALSSWLHMVLMMNLQWNCKFPLLFQSAASRVLIAKPKLKEIDTMHNEGVRGQ